MSEKPKDPKQMERDLKVVRDFLTPLIQHFTLPGHVTDKNLFFQPFKDALGGFSEKVLSAAAKRIIATRTYPTFPLPSECIEMVNAVHSQFHPEPAISEKKAHYPEWSPERREAANRMMQSAVGKQACEEGWQVALWDFMREKRRAPDAAEARAIRARSLSQWAETNAYYAGPKVFPPAWGWLRMIQTRQRHLTKIVAGELSPESRLRDMIRNEENS